jgi:23S rRNA (uracil1939-C5)-methyltransferase
MTSAVRILRLAAGGDGVGKLEDGRTVFVPRTAPGDVAELSELRLSRRYARARPHQILERSPLRVEPPCTHYTTDECGGCQLQHLAYPAQLDSRRGFAGDALRRLARLDRDDPPIEAAPRQFGYRTRITLAARHGRIGLHRYGRPGAVFDLQRCPITAEALNAVWANLRESRALLPPGLEQLTLRLDRGGNCHVITRVAGASVWGEARELARKLAGAGTPATLWWEPEGGVPRVIAGRAGGEAPAGVFEQVHPEMAARARSFAVNQLGPVEAAQVWDLYAGLGDTTTLLAARGAAVSSVELDQRAVTYAERTGPPAFRHAGPVEHLAAALPTPEMVVTNPPRSGMNQIATAVLRECGARRIAYISCDPATLARDVVRLAPVYRLREARCFDFFPQTAHVETVAVLERA